jgi:hypothetical protein
LDSKTQNENPDRLQSAWLRARAASHRSILNSAAISRGDRELLTRANRIRRLMKGWYTLEIGIPSSNPPHGMDGIPTPVFFDFLGVYLEDRLGSRWCLSAESSLQFRMNVESIPDRIIALTEYGSTTHHRFEGLTELTVYRDPDRFPPHSTTWAGLRLMSPEDALARIKPSALERDSLLIKKALPLIRQWENYAEVLAQEGRHTAAIRLHQELVTAGFSDQAGRFQQALIATGLLVTSGPHPQPQQDQAPNSVTPTPDSNTPWTDWYGHLTNFPLATVNTPPALLDLLSNAQELSPDDAVASLALSGFDLSIDQVLMAMTEPERAASAAGWPVLEDDERMLPNGHQEPLPGDADPQALLALQGYVEAGRLVRRSIVRLLEEEPLAKVLEQDLPQWHRALLLPSCDAGLVPESQLGVFREASDAPIIATSLELLWEAAGRLREARSQALMAHLGLLWIQPWKTGNGRMARFLLNALRMAGKNHWLVIGEKKRREYQALLADTLAGQSPISLLELLEQQTDPAYLDE